MLSNTAKNNQQSWSLSSVAGSQWNAGNSSFQATLGVPRKNPPLAAKWILLWIPLPACNPTNHFNPLPPPFYLFIYFDPHVDHGHNTRYPMVVILWNKKTWQTFAGLPWLTNLWIAQHGVHIKGDFSLIIENYWLSRDGIWGCVDPDDDVDDLVEGVVGRHRAACHGRGQAEASL